MIKNRILALCSMFLVLISFTACGSDFYPSEYSMQTDSINGGMINGERGISTSSYMDYSDTYISGNMADYSYIFRANGQVNKKDTVLKIYSDIEEFVISKDGYISNVNNNYNGYALDSEYRYSDREVKNVATGTMYFSIEIPKEYTSEVVERLDDFVNANEWTVTQYRQTIVNYEGVKVVDYKDDDYRTYTQEEIDDILKYATITVTLDYRIPRGVFSSFGATLHNIVYDSKEVLAAVFGVIIVIGIGVYVSLYVIVLPVCKLFIKSMFKYKKKHRDYFYKEVINHIKDLDTTDQT